MVEYIVIRIENKESNVLDLLKPIEEEGDIELFEFDSFKEMSYSFRR